MAPLRCVRKLIITGGVALVLSGCDRETVRPGPSPRTASPPWFRDVTAESGLEFVHDSGATGSYFMPESIGSGGALFDYDNDGRLDIYLVHCVAPESGSRNRLFHQESDGRFRDVSKGSGLDVTGHGMGVAAGDVTNDGLPDLFLTEYGRTRLFLNRGFGRFEDGSGSAGIDNPRWGTSASLLDFDRDGWLDVVIANYVDYDPTHACPDARGQPEYCGPEHLAGTVARLFHNEGLSNGIVRFRDVTVASGLAQKLGPALGVFCADFDGDRWPDIFLADDGRPNRLFVNQRNGTFADEAVPRGLAYNAQGATAANMGIAAGDVNSDGLLDLLVTHLIWEQPALWQQGPRGLFQDTAASTGLAQRQWRGTGFGAVLADFDADGAPDLALANGAIKRADTPGPRLPGLKEFWWPYAQRNQLFAQDGFGRFRDISDCNPDFCGPAGVGRGLACGDLNNDGAPDLLALCSGGPARILRAVAPNRGHWLLVRAVDPARGGRDAIGAEITLEASGRKWWRVVQPGYSYLVSNDPRAHFGLGKTASFDRIRVVWPDGTEEGFPGGTVNRSLVLRKGTRP